jgi:hypothetical protein
MATVSNIQPIKQPSLLLNANAPSSDFSIQQASTSAEAKTTGTINPVSCADARDGFLNTLQVTGERMDDIDAYRDSGDLESANVALIDIETYHQRLEDLLPLVTSEKCSSETSEAQRAEFSGIESDIENYINQYRSTFGDDGSEVYNSVRNWIGSFFNSIRDLIPGR